MHLEFVRMETSEFLSHSSSGLMSRNWHDLVGETSISSTALAGATSSAITKTILFPVDTIKCRIQSGSSFNPFRLQGIMNGLIPKICLYAPYQAIYMSVYTSTRNWLRPSDSNLWKYAAAGVAAELAGSVIRVPMEAIKQRMQTGSIKSNRDLIGMLMRSPLQFYNRRNFLAQTFIHDIPCGTIHWVVYEYTKRNLSTSAATAGAVAGAVAAIVTNPLDVVKTRMITRPEEHKTVFNTIQAIRQSRSGFFAGVIPRVFHIAPNSALYMFIFDTMFTAIDRLNTN